jgi:type I restriction enzyme R subunit
VKVIRWRDRQEPRAVVRSTIEVILNTLPEDPYPKDLWDEKVEATWEFVLARYATGSAGMVDAISTG